MVMLSDEEDKLIDFLEDNFGCHTVIVYGSRGEGGAPRPDSDWDVLAITDVGSRNFCHELIDGVGDVSAHIFNSDDVEFDMRKLSGLYHPLNHFVRLRHGRVLVQQDGIGDTIIKRAKQLYAGKAPKSSPEYEVHHRYNLLGYGLGGLRNPHYTAAHKQFIRCEILPWSMMVYFDLRRMWQPSPKDAIAYLEMADPKGYALMSAAFEPSADADTIEAWVQHVLAVENI